MSPVLSPLPPRKRWSNFVSRDQESRSTGVMSRQTRLHGVPTLVVESTINPLFLGSGPSRDGGRRPGVKESLSFRRFDGETARPIYSLGAENPSGVHRKPQRTEGLHLRPSMVKGTVEDRRRVG